MSYRRTNRIGNCAPHHPAFAASARIRQRVIVDPDPLVSVRCFRLDLTDHVGHSRYARRLAISELKAKVVFNFHN